MGFLMFLKGRERDQWHGMDQTKNIFPFLENDDLIALTNLSDGTVVGSNSESKIQTDFTQLKALTPSRWKGTEGWAVLLFTA